MQAMGWDWPRRTFSLSLTRRHLPFYNLIHSHHCQSYIPECDNIPWKYIVLSRSMYLHWIVYFLLLHVFTSSNWLRSIHCINVNAPHNPHTLPAIFISGYHASSNSSPPIQSSRSIHWRRASSPPPDVHNGHLPRTCGDGERRGDPGEAIRSSDVDASGVSFF